MPEARPVRPGGDHERDPVRVRAVRLVFDRAWSVEEVGWLVARIRRAVQPDPPPRVEIDQVAR